MNVTRHEKVNRMAESGQNLCGNAFFSNAERMMTALEAKNCNELTIKLSMTVKASNKDEAGVGKIEFEDPCIELSKHEKYKDKLDNVILDFVEPKLDNFDKACDEAGKEEKKVNGQVIPESRRLTTSEVKEVFIYKDKNGKTYYAGQGLGDDAFMTFKGLPTDNARHRYVTKALPVQKTLEDAEGDLIAYALKKGWKRITQEGEKAKGDTMEVENNLTIKDISPRCDESFGCCQCEKESCKKRQVDFGNAVGCLTKWACSEMCPRIIDNKKEAENLTLESEEDKYIYGREGLAFCDNAHKLAEYGYSAIKLELENKDILEWEKGTNCFRPKGERFKTQAATKREFEKLLVDDEGIGYLNIDKPDSWIRRSGISNPVLFRGDKYALRIRFQTVDKSWGSPEKFDTEIQFKSRLDELRNKLNYFEA